jgi:hypothetical protein
MDVSPLLSFDIENDNQDYSLDAFYQSASYHDGWHCYQPIDRDIVLSNVSFLAINQT